MDLQGAFTAQTEAQKKAAEEATTKTDQKLMQMWEMMNRPSDLNDDDDDLNPAFGRKSQSTPKGSPRGRSVSRTPDMQRGVRKSSRMRAFSSSRAPPESASEVDAKKAAEAMAPKEGFQKDETVTVDG